MTESRLCLLYISRAINLLAIAMMQQPVTSPPLLNSDEFKKKTNALKEALRELSNQTKKPSFLVTEPDIVPDALIKSNPKVETVSVLDVLSVELDDI